MSSRIFSLIRPKVTPFLTTRTLRTMASGAVSIPQGKYEFLVVVPDKPGVLEKRLSVRGQHFEDMKPKVESGNMKMGGAILNSVPKDDSPSSLDFAGSTLVCIAESAEEVREQLSKDIYATSGVWDMDKVQIYPFKAAFRFN
ncbi:unnamed protein product [Fusarium equiseti]|uniref:YCII-related domain-containing protein n=1 Tax=Fusarium equiseti TaxID=61235 RepID=A0A8J2N9J8_FUSEQ|nr:unnamed protein product [Fusarium equiseti]